MVRGCTPAWNCTRSACWDWPPTRRPRFSATTSVGCSGCPNRRSPTRSRRGEHVSSLEMSTESSLDEFETDEERRKRLRKLRNRRLAVIMRIYALIHPPPTEPVLPPPPPPVVEVDPRRRRRGGQGGSREDERAALPEAAVMERLGRLAASTRSEADAEAYVGAL